jgi:hypothetical protein
VQTKDFGQLNSVIIYQHYKAFIAHLDKIGADLSKVRVGKAEAVSLLVHEHTMPREQVADRRLLLLQRDGRLCGGELICTCRQRVYLLHLTVSFDLRQHRARWQSIEEEATARRRHQAHPPHWQRRVGGAKKRGSEEEGRGRRGER